MLLFSMLIHQVTETYTQYSWLSEDSWATVYEPVNEIQMITDLFSSERHKKYILNSKSQNLQQWAPF